MERVVFKQLEKKNPHSCSLFTSLLVQFCMVIFIQVVCHRL